MSQSKSQLATSLDNSKIKTLPQPIPINQHIKSSKRMDMQKNQSSLQTSIINSPKQALSSSRRLILQKHDLIMMQSQVRRLANKITLEHELKKNKKLYEEMQRQIQEKEQQYKKNRRQKIMNKIEQIQQKRKQRQKQFQETNKTVAHLKLKQFRKQIVLGKLLEDNKKNYEQCYKKALKQRKRLLKPIDFQKIDMHQKRYLKNKYRHRTQIQQQQEIQEQQQQQQQNRNSRQSKNKRSSKNSNRSSTVRRHTKMKTNQEQQNQEQNNSNDGTVRSRSIALTKRQYKSSLDQYLQTRRKQEQRIEQIKQILNKRKQYGNRVEKQYHKNRAKTESIQFVKQKQRIFAEQHAKQIMERNKLLKNMKKPNLPIEINVQIGKNYQLKKIKKGNYSPEQKLLKLNRLLQSQNANVKLKDRYEDLQRVNKINMARAQILLGLDWSP